MYKLYVNDYPTPLQVKPKQVLGCILAYSIKHLRFMDVNGMIHLCTRAIELLEEVAFEDKQVSKQIVYLDSLIDYATNQKARDYNKVYDSLVNFIVETVMRNEDLGNLPNFTVVKISGKQKQQISKNAELKPIRYIPGGVVE